MSTERQITASRTNGAKSRGPVTPDGKLKSVANTAQSTGPRTSEGKARSSRNAVRHSLYAQSIVLTSESAEMFTEILAAYDAALRPADAIEQRYVETMASAEWGRRRMLSMDKEQLEMEMEKQQHAAFERFITPGAPTSDPLSADPSPTADSAVVEINPARILVQAFNAVNDSHTAELRSRYENRCDRQYTRALKGLCDYRDEKRRMAADKNRDGTN
jgi:hypothetical protein